MAAPRRRPARGGTPARAHAALVFGLAAALLACAARPAAAALPDCAALLAKYKANGYKDCVTLAPGKSALLWKGKGNVLTLRPVYAVQQESELGWLGVGFSDMGSMKGADIYIVHKDDSGSAWAVSDCNAPEVAKPVLDASQDAKLLGMAFDAASSTWSAEITRRMKTCDLANDFEIQPGRGQYVIWAFGPVDPTLKGFAAVQQHYLASRGYFPLDLFPVVKSEAFGGYVRPRLGGRRLAATPKRNTLPAEELAKLSQAVVGAFQSGWSAGPKCFGDGCDANPVPGAAPASAARTTATASLVGPITDNGDGTKTITVLCKADIPPVETTYMTCYVELPSDQIYHIVRYKGIYGHETVHHSLGYSCTPDAEAKVSALIAASGPGPYNQKSHNQICEVFYLVPPSPYTADPYYRFPKKAGLPFGKGKYKYIAIEVHYNNPKGTKGLVDPGTGLELVFEVKKRRKDVGVLTNAQFLLNIPGGKPMVKAGESICHTDCTKRFNSSVTMIAQNVHMHGLGAGVTTRRTRKGKAMEPLINVRGFDYAFQGWSDMPDKQRILKRGDELGMTCVFDSRGRTNTTNWGYSTQEEMCFWWIYYYPAQEAINVCSTLDMGSTYGGKNLNLCVGDVGQLIALKAAADAGKLGEATRILQSMTDKGEAFVGDPQAVTTEFDASAGCSSQLP